jgi:hypothetical protein
MVTLWAMRVPSPMTTPRAPPSIEVRWLMLDTRPQHHRSVQEHVGGDGAAIADHHRAVGLGEDRRLRGDEAVFADHHGLQPPQLLLHLLLPGARPRAVRGLERVVQPRHPGQALLVLGAIVLERLAHGWRRPPWPCPIGRDGIEKRTRCMGFLRLRARIRGHPGRPPVARPTAYCTATPDRTMFEGMIDLAVSRQRLWWGLPAPGSRAC